MSNTVIKLGLVGVLCCLACEPVRDPSEVKALAEPMRMTAVSSCFLDLALKRVGEGVALGGGAVGLGSGWVALEEPSGSQASKTAADIGESALAVGIVGGLTLLVIGSLKYAHDGCVTTVGPLPVMDKKVEDTQR